VSVSSATSIIGVQSGSEASRRGGAATGALIVLHANAASAAALAAGVLATATIASAIVSRGEPPWSQAD
jgi:hypothetical protein